MSGIYVPKVFLRDLPGTTQPSQKLCFSIMVLKVPPDFTGFLISLPLQCNAIQYINTIQSVQCNTIPTTHLRCYIYHCNSLFNLKVSMKERVTERWFFCTIPFNESFMIYVPAKHNVISGVPYIMIPPMACHWRPVVAPQVYLDTWRLLQVL